MSFPSNPTELTIWCAGLFEGEGYCALKKKYNCNFVEVVVRVTMCTPKSLKPFTLLVPGTEIVPLATKQKEHHRQKYDWSLWGNRAVDFLRLMEPYLIDKQEQAQLIIEYAEKHYGKGYKRDEKNGRYHKLPEDIVNERMSYAKRVSALKHVEHTQ